MSWAKANSLSALGNGSPSTATITITGVTPGNLLIVAGAGSADPATVSDGSNTYIKRGAVQPSGHLFMWSSVVTTGGTLVISAGTLTFWTLNVIEFSPGGTIATTGANPTATGNSTTPAAGNITISTPALVLGAYLQNTGTSTWSSNGNFTYDAASGTNLVAGLHYGVALSYWLAANASPQNPAITLSGAGGQWGAIGAAFTSTTPSGGPWPFLTDQSESGGYWEGGL